MQQAETHGMRIGQVRKTAYEHALGAKHDSKPERTCRLSVLLKTQIPVPRAPAKTNEGRKKSNHFHATGILVAAD